MKTEEKEDATSTALVTIERASAQEVFTNPEKVSGMLTQLRQLVGCEIYTADTPEGRARIKDIERKLKKTKSVADAIGKELVDDLKALPKLIDGGRKQLRDGIDLLVAEIRAPLTEYEAEQDRIKAEKAEAERREQERQRAVTEAIHSITATPIDYIGKHSSLIREVIREQEDELADIDPELYGDRIDEARSALAESIDKLTHLAEQAEAQEQADTERQAREAADNAARREQAASRQRELAAQVAAQREKDEKEAALLRAQQAEADAAKAKADADQKAEQARLDEQKRIAEQQRAEQEAAEKRAADLKHTKAKNREALDALMDCGIVAMIREAASIGEQDKMTSGISDEQVDILNQLITQRLEAKLESVGKRIVICVARGDIPNMTMVY